ncbi:MAG: choice-of-anchor D domain-containing protein, partial [Calditrichaeota bacterium]|nr:choice-of-anchor D domain-containing protein [Calditrichota bacterium]
MSSSIRRLAGVLLSSIAITTISLLPAPDARAETGLAGIAPSADAHRPLTDVDVVFSPSTVEVSMVSGDTTHVNLALENTHDDQPEDLSWELQIQFPETALFQAGTVRPAPRGDSGIPPLNTTHPDFSSSPDWQDMSRDGERTRSALIIGNEATSDVIQDVLLEAGYSSVIVSDDGIYNGTNPSPVEFDLVIYPDGINYGSNMPTSGQTALRDYVLSGGGLITTEWVSYEIESGRLTTLATVLPMRRSGGGTGQTYCQVDLPAHPLVSGVPSSFYVTSGYSSTYLLSGESVISSPDMGVAVAADESNGGRVVQFGVAGNYSGYSPFGPGTELRMVLANAIDWVAGTNWLTASPLSGTVLANTVADIDLRISAEGLLEGDYIATLHVVSAQFTNGFIDVPVIVHVDGDPAIAVNPPQLDFGSTFVGQTSTLVLEIGNQGTAPLNITAITTDNTAFQVLPADLVIQPLETAMVDVSHSPLSPAVNNTTLHILSDDPLQGDLQLSILAEALDAPIAAIAPESVELDGLTGDTLTTSLSLDNLGGSDLDWVTGVVYGSGARVTSPTAAARENQARHRDTGKGEVETRAPLSASRQFGGPDAFGYSWMDSNTPGGPEFVWEDISGIGESLGLYGDDEFATVTLPFAFPYYGSMESTLNVSTNGYITFGDDAFEPLGDPFPDPVEPNGVIAPLWGDLANYEGSTYTWYDEDNARFIIQFNDYYGTYFSGFYTFQIVLEESGDILFNYDVIEDATDEFAIGIEDQNGFDGLTISYYSSYAQAGLAVRFSSSSAGHWLSVLPSSGTTGSSGTSVLELSATPLQNMLSGVYEATVVVASNDPATPELQVPVTLTVTGAPQLVVDQQEINWGDVYIDHGQSRWLLLHNPGTADLLLDAQTDGNGFSVTNGTQLIPPFGSLALQLYFLTASAGQYNGLLTLASNDPQQGTVLVTLLANAIPAPEIAATPGSFDVTLDAGTMLSEDLVIDNLGGSSLDWQRQIRNLQVNSARSANIGFHANPATERPHPRQPHPADPGNPAGALTDQGDVLNYWDNFIYYAAAMVHTGDGLWVLGENSGGERDGEGSVGNENSLYLYDTDLGYEVFSFPVEPWTYSLAWDGQFLWVGADDGTVYGYDLNGNPVGDFSLPNFAWYSYQLVFDGQDFLVVYPDQYQIQRVDYTGAELEVGQYSDSIGYVNAVAWVPGHFSGHLWVFDSDYNDLVQLSNTLQNPEEVTRIDFLDVGWTRAMAHNGTNLLVANNWGEMWEVDDGQEEVDFFALDPVSGSVEPSSGVVAHMLFNSPGNFGGTVSADLVLQSNDPVQPELIVPLSLTVNGRPILGTDLVDLDFGSQYVGGSTSRVVRVRNLGSETLQISNIIAGLPDYTPSFTSVTLEPGLFSDLEIVFSPAQSGDRGTLLSLISNDPQQPIHDLTLSGTGLQAPELVVDPEVFTEWLASGTEGDYTLTVSNEGPGDLEYTVGFTQYARSLETRTPRAPDPELNLAKNERDPRPGQAPARGAGGPDSYGYTWRDSDEPNGPAYQWHDIVSSGEGVNLFLSGDDSAVSVTLPFAFPFYGNDYTTMWVSTNGYLTFGPNPYDYSNDPIPSTNQPNLFIAPFWDDLNGANNYWYWHDTVQNRVVIQYNNVAHLNGSGTYLMQAVLYSNGTIDYYYNTLNGTLTSCSVGIENIDGDDGLQVVYNAAWLHNDMAIRISATPGWLDVTPLAGTVAPGSSENLALHVNAQSLLDGAYDANIVVYSNDPLRPQATVPFHLTVAGFADIVVAQQSIDFGTVFTGSTNQLPVTVQNVGTGHLTLSALSTTGEGFSVEAAPIVIAPGFSRQVMVSFAPDQIGPVSGTLSIESDDEDTPLVEVVLAGNAEAPPVVAVSPASVTETIAAGETIELDLLVDNSMGATSLDWTIEVDDLGGNRFLLVREGRSAQRKGQTTAERDASWLTVEPLAGSVAPGQSQSLTMTIEAPLDYAGQYLGQIRVLSN